MKIRALVVEPGKMPEAQEIENHEKIYREIVDGWFEIISMGRNEKKETYVLYCNENAKRRSDLQINREVRGHLIVGNFLITKIDRVGGEMSLSDEDVAKLTAELSKTAVNTNIN